MLNPFHKNNKMKILIVGTFKWEMYSPAFVHGFRLLGHTVDYIDTSAYYYGGSRQSFLNKVQEKYHIGLPLFRLNKDILTKVKEMQPDLVFFYYCLDVFKSTYLEIKRTGAKFFTYCNDDPFSKILDKPWCRRFHHSLPIADWNFVYRKKNILDYQKAGIDKVSVLLPYYLTNKNYYLNIKRDVPIAFVGHFENDNRDIFIKALLDNNIPVTVYSSQWNEAPLYESIRQCFQPGKQGEEYNELLNKLQVAIVFLSKINHDTYTRRCFELPATKTCMLCEYTEDMNRMFPEGECAVYFRNIDEFIARAKELLQDPDRCKKIGENSFRRVTEIGGSEVDRCREIVEKYEELTKQ